jgi:hypothetical protein
MKLDARKKIRELLEWKRFYLDDRNRRLQCADVCRMRRLPTAVYGTLDSPLFIRDIDGPCR